MAHHLGRGGSTPLNMASWGVSRGILYPVWIASRNWGTHYQDGTALHIPWGLFGPTLMDVSTLDPPWRLTIPLPCQSPFFLLQGTHSRLHGAPIHHSILNSFLTTHSTSTILSNSISTSWWFSSWTCKGITPSSWCMMRAIYQHSLWVGPWLQPDWPSSLNCSHS